MIDTVCPGVYIFAWWTCLDSPKKITTECPGLRLRQASRVVSKIYDDALRPSGLQVSQLPILVALALFGESGAGMNALAEAVVMDRTTLTRNVQPVKK